VPLEIVTSRCISGVFDITRLPCVPENPDSLPQAVICRDCRMMSLSQFIHSWKGVFKTPYIALQSHHTVITFGLPQVPKSFQAISSALLSLSVAVVRLYYKPQRNLYLFQNPYRPARLPSSLSDFHWIIRRGRMLFRIADPICGQL